jgi:hypothetical protein
MPYRRVVWIAAVALLCLPPLGAQEAPLVPPGMDALAAHATFHTDFTFDKSMLEAASQLMPDEDRPVIAKLRSITVDSYRYSSPGMYDAAALDAVRKGYSGHGWNHLVTKQTQPAAATAETMGATGTFDPTRTDVWVRMAHGNVEGVVLLVANGRNVNLVLVDGMISPLDLLHLRGHFGIPRFSGDDLEDAR